MPFEHRKGGYLESNSKTQSQNSKTNQINCLIADIGVTPSSKPAPLDSKGAAPNFKITSSTQNQKLNGKNQSSLMPHLRGCY
jgi:hypothetical protein